MFDYQIKSGKRKNVAIEIKNGTVILRVPDSYLKNACAMNQAKAFLTEKTDWVAKKIEEQKLSEFNAFPGFADRSNLYLFGYPVNKKFSEHTGQITFEQGVLFLPAKFINNKTLFEKALKNWYKSIAQKELSLRLEKISQRIGKKYSSFALSSARGKWGSCSTDKKILLSWRLVILPEELIEYVIIHELCHTVFMDHSSAFWSEVHNCLQDYKILRKRIKNYRNIMNLI